MAVPRTGYYGLKAYMATIRCGKYHFVSHLTHVPSDVSVTMSEKKEQERETKLPQLEGDSVEVE